jgi:hypothetical protein
MIGLLIIGFVIAFLQSRNVILREKNRNDPKIMAVTVTAFLAFVSIVLLEFVL